MKLPLDTHFLPLTEARSARLRVAGLCLGALLSLAGTSAAQSDNDDDGVLPFAAGNEDEATASGVVGVSTAIEADVVEANVGRIGVEALSGETTIEEHATDPVFFAEPGTVIAQPVGDGYLLQGRGQLVAPETLPMTLEPAQQSDARTLVILLDDGSASLDELLAGTAPPAQVVVVGDVAAVSLQGFQSLVTSHADDLPGMHATLVMVSVDGSGTLHLTAVRAATQGGALEVVTG